MRDDDMLGFLILAAIVGIGFGAGYGVRDLISRRRRHRHRDWLGEWSPRPDPSRANPKPANPNPPNLKREPRPAEPIGDVAIDLDRLLVAVNDDRAGRQQPRRAVPPSAQENRRDEYDVAVRNLLVELSRRSSHEQALTRRANVERQGQSRDRILGSKRR
jgi:hypothetical protein